MRKTLLRLITAALLCLILTPLYAGQTLEEGSDDEFLISQYYPLTFVIRIEAPNAGGGSRNGNPPRPMVYIAEVLKGDERFFSGQILNALWRPLPSGVDWIGSGADEILREWRLSLLEEPEADTLWIVSGGFQRDILFISPFCRYPFEPGVYQWVTGLLE